jgi:two-component system nitrogen regulation sensor histidine kinase NtrY
VLNDLVKSTVLFQETGQPDVIFKSEIPLQKILIDADPAMIGRSITNLLKNAGEAISDLDSDASIKTGEIRISLSASDKTIILEISDNGKGLPQDRSRLFEPYVTNRPSGTGLGLSIVAKTIEEHGGIFSLVDAEPFSAGAHNGAKAIIKLPRMNLLT